MPTKHPVPASLSTLFSHHLDVLTKRLEKALETTGYDSVVILAGNQQQIGRSDLSYPYSVEPYFNTWVPLTQNPGCILKLAPAEKPLLVYVQPENYWQETIPDPEGHWAQHFNIQIAKTSDDALKMITPTKMKQAFIGPDADNTGDCTAFNDSRLLNELNYFRAFKTDYEIKCIEYANQIAAQGHIAVQNTFPLGVSEFHINHVYCAATNQRETELPYPSVVALNEHASILHYQNLNQRSPIEIHSLLLDAGAQFNGYASDITRTWCAQNRRFQKLIAAVDSMQQLLCSQAIKGTDFVELNDQAHRLVAEILSKQKFVFCSAAQAYETGITRTFFPHGLGHLLGLQVHDTGGHQKTPNGALRSPPAKHPHLRLTRVLEPGFVLTIEPGIYFIPMLLKKLSESTHKKHINWDLIEEFIPFGGVRIEDNIVVTTSKVCNLTRQFLPSMNTVSVF